MKNENKRISNFVTGIGGLGISSTRKLCPGESKLALIQAFALLSNDRNPARFSLLRFPQHLNRLYDDLFLITKFSYRLKVATRKNEKF